MTPATKSDRKFELKFKLSVPDSVDFCMWDQVVTAEFGCCFSLMSKGFFSEYFSIVLNL